MADDFYCYELRDPTAGDEPIYVGKGRGLRFLEHGVSTHNKGLAERIASIRAAGFDVTARVVKHFGNNENAAFKYERYLVNLYGRIDRGTGTLYNRTDGGTGTSGTWSDLTNARFGRLVAVKLVGTSSRRSVRWLCKCDCGTERTLSADRLTAGDTKSCGCLRREATSRRKTKDVTGQRFGRLVAVRSLGIASGGRSRWLCKCDCGNEHAVEISSLGRNARSCGCLNRELSSKRVKERVVARRSEV